MRLTRQLAVQIPRLAWLLTCIGGVWLVLVAFCALACIVFVGCALLDTAAWVFLLPGRVLHFLTQPRLPRGWK